MVTGHTRNSVYDGSDWSAPTQIPQVQADLRGVSCVSASFCDVAGGSSVVAYDGSTWSDAVRPPGALSLLDISCSSSTFCAAVGYVVAYTWDGTTWTKSKRIDPKSNMSSVSCISPSFCVAGDDHGRAFQWNGAKWSAPIVVIKGSAYTSSVSCVTETFCAMVTERHPKVSFFDGTTWSHPVTIDDPARGGLVGISCPSTNLCTVLDGAGYVLTWRHRSA